MECIRRTFEAVSVEGAVALVVGVVPVAARVKVPALRVQRSRHGGAVDDESDADARAHGHVSQSAHVAVCMFVCVCALMGVQGDDVKQDKARSRVSDELVMISR